VLYEIAVTYIYFTFKRYSFKYLTTLIMIEVLQPEYAVKGWNDVKKSVIV
jgi:hypothetical protein